MRELTHAQRDAEIATLQARLLDYTGHVRAELSPAQTSNLIRRINRLRSANGWHPLDMTGRNR